MESVRRNVLHEIAAPNWNMFGKTKASSHQASGVNVPHVYRQAVAVKRCDGGAI